MKKLQNLLFFLSLLFGLIMVPIGAQAVTNEAGYYIYGSNYTSASPSSSTHLQYKLKLLPGSTDEYYIDLYASTYSQNIMDYYSGNMKMVTFNMEGSTFKLCHISTDNGSIDTYSPSASGDSWWITGNASSQTLNHNGNKSWYIQNNGGMYRFIVKVNASGAPQSFRVVSYPNRIVAYVLSETNNWTTDFLICERTSASSGGTLGYNGNFFGATSFDAKGTELVFVLANVWFKRKNDNNYYTKDLSIDGPSDNNLHFPEKGGVYGIEFNANRSNYIIKSAAGEDNTETKIYIIGSAVKTTNTISTNVFANWDTNESIELVYDKNEQCWKGEVTLLKDKDMRFLHNNNLAKNFQEDNYAPEDATTPVGPNNDTQVHNRVQYSTSTTNDAKNVHFKLASGKYIVRFYISKEGAGDFSTSNGVYWYTLEQVEQLTDPTVNLSPASQSVPDNQTVTTSLTADNTTYFAYTVGTAEGTPTIGSKATVASNFFGTLSYDKTNNRISWGGSNYVSGRTITITVQAVTADGTALVPGTKVTRTYTFTDTSVSITPDGGFFINKKELTLGGTAPYTWNVKDASNNVLASGTIESGNTLMLSTAGTLTVTDANNQSGTADFDFTYSTSENYSNYYNNSKNTVVTPGAITVFVKSTGSAPYLKAWNPSNASDVYVNNVQLSSTKTNGSDTWYYYTLPSTVTSAKIRFDFNGNGGWMSGVKTISADAYFIYDKVNCVIIDVTDAQDLYNSNNNTVYWVANASAYYVHTWGNNTTATTAEMTKSDKLKAYIDNSETVYSVFYYSPTSLPGSILFKPNSGEDYAGKTDDLTYTKGNVYSSIKDINSQYAMLSSVPTSWSPFVEGSTTVTYAKPNGDDYYRVMSKDKTYLLDPTWNSSTNITTQTSVKSWDMVSNAHRVNGSISQTVTGLTANKEYAVQALVSSTNMNDITLTLTGANSGTATLGSHYSGQKNFVNKYGRVEFLDNQVDKNTTTMWQVLYAKAQANASGELTIALSCASSGTFYLTDVVLLEGTASERNYIMSVATGEDNTEVDLSDRTQYNAFSFFNRGINLNSVIYVSDHTVLGVAPGVLTDDDIDIDRRHPYNVAAYNATTGAYTMKKMYLTDQQSAGKTGNDNAFGVSKTFTTSSFYYDRNITSTTNKMSSYLPIALTSSEIPGGNAYVFDHIDNVNNTVSFTNVSSVAANTPFFFVSPNTGVVFDINTEKTVVASPAAKTIAQATSGAGSYMLGFYSQASNVGSTSVGYRQNDYVPYFYQNGKFSWAKETAHVNPFRAIFMHYTGTAVPASMVALWDEPEVTGIDEVETVTPQSTAIYSIDGKLVNRSGNTDGLRKGVYIMNGKKFIVK